MSRPGYQRIDANVANITIVAVEFGGSGDAEAIRTEAAADNLGLVVQQADPRRSRTTSRVVEFDRDRIAFDRIDVDTIAERSGETAAGNACTYDDRIRTGFLDGVRGTIVPGRVPLQRDTVTRRHDAIDGSIAMNAHATPLADGGQLPGKFMNVTGRIGRSKKATVKLTMNCRFDGSHFLRRDRMALKTASLQERVDFAGVIEALAVTVDMKNATTLEIKIDSLTLGDRK